MKNKKAKKRNPVTTGMLIILVVLVLILIVYTFFLDIILRNQMPRRYVHRAVANTLNAMAPDLSGIFPLLAEIAEDSWRQTVTLSASRLDGGFFHDLDAQVRSYLPSLRIRNVTQYDAVREAYTSEFALQAWFTTILNWNFNMNAERIAFTIPQAYDFYLTTAPDRAMSEWDASYLAEFLTGGFMGDERFALLYERLFFRPAPEAVLADFWASLADLERGITYHHYSRHQSDVVRGGGNMDTVSRFVLTVPADALNTSFGLLQAAIAPHVEFLERLGVTPDATLSALLDLYFAQDMRISLTIHDGFVVAADASFADFTRGFSLHFAHDGGNTTMTFGVGFDAVELYGTWRFEMQAWSYQVISLAVQTPARRHELDLILDWDWSDISLLTNNFRIVADWASYYMNAPGGTHVHFEIGGNAEVFHNRRHFELDCNVLRIIVRDMDTDEPWLDVSLHLQIRRYAHDDDVFFVPEGSWPLAQLSESQMMSMYLKLQDSFFWTQFGAFLPTF